MKSARRRSRELATQGLYQWLLSGSPGGEIDAQLRGAQGFDKADHEHLDAILHGVIRDSEALSAAIAPCLDRPIEQLSPVERAVLLVAAFELKNHVDIPYRVVINEAVELAKTFGGADGYKYVNGVLDKLSAQLRVDETQAARKR
ncbi:MULTISPECIES: transcription antitermination factor NusB [Paraburkholderia]|jgi:N utilization substance protein B|uniref:Transcription antitermination protein NusB n=3 Tax=Paraburkholderia TaxID=1822464 RepID=NUSB_PARPJ|nr:MULTISPECIES: transcription antitermination factor NusB [Paraburkholderia]B2T6D1.1 RecName: Full=Transcription antitermination protein NusB; AltName: Full=Antitermination factor NusB [Paraburkholderia phytofirmans PsJN]ACD17495.1 NusB antitermination factor [Paraburkholderia phytofirmans PsJN]PRX26850.1 NusB antitermination factor [Paraburkholderia sp. BL18I3N2]TFE46611.1 transcription antitermination factor NusB [Paraburkholderia dipogonis]